MVVLYFLGKQAQKKKEEQDEQMKAVAQTVTMLVIDKKRMKLRDAGLPAQVMEQTNKMMQRAKMPIVKAKVGPVRKEIKATVSGLYITAIRGLRGPLEKPENKKKSLRAKLQAKYDEANAQLTEEEAKEAKAKAEKAKQKEMKKKLKQKV